MVMSKYKVIGVMSGTSLDGIDLVYAEFDYNDTWEFEIIFAETIPYTSDWVIRLKGLINYSIQDLQVLDIKYTEYLSSVISKFMHDNKIETIDFISSHGHTALHQPELGLTYQIGNLQIMSDVLRQKVICDFRIQDVDFGGQGAPLVPVGDHLLFSEYDYCLNLGGFANISFEKNNTRIAFDICPVNIVLNHYVSFLDLEYDDRGIQANGGKVSIGLLDDLNRLDFYNLTPPKSLGLEWVKKNIFPVIDAYKLNVQSVLRTFVEHIAFQISTILSEGNGTVLITGGGAYNDFLISRISSRSKCEIVIPQSNLIEFKEALIFGFLGVLKDRNEVNCLRDVTGAKTDHSSGKILLPNT
ncbi:MAG: anhydro-N-acetylmuramic acid kinase [Winogradskyella sp.]|nr:anhydro-N-acetylmuramic acid kinase [Winogradskyella sp.]NRB83186.1 anhydro-N-acetylmuramic acid kinase [Winogradskyella sp.]